MKSFLISLVSAAALALPAYAFDSISVTNDIHVQVNEMTSKISVTENQNTIQEISFDASQKNAVRFADFNFDGLVDLQVFRERGTEEYFDIYLFDSKEKRFTKNTKLSELPCPVINKGKKLVIGSCFKASACDRWEEVYKWAADDLVLVEKKGTYCDPSNGKSYSYREMYSGNKLIKKTVSKLKSR
jgi:hypothetical protein